MNRTWDLLGFGITAVDDVLCLPALHRSSITAVPVSPVYG
jgi:hypothetical protein